MIKKAKPKCRTGHYRNGTPQYYRINDIIIERKSIADELERIYAMLYQEGFGEHKELFELAKELRGANDEST